MKRILALAAVLLAAAAAPSPTPAPIVTTFLRYKIPHGYRVREESAFAGGAKVTAVALVDGYGNRDVTITLSGRGGTLRGEYLVMDGLVYAKGATGWSPASAGRELLTMLFSASYPASAAFQAPAKIVTEQGTAPCEPGTCRLYLASGVTPIGGQPMATVAHLALDPQTAYLASLQMQIMEHDGTQFTQAEEQYDQFDAVRLEVPDISSQAAASQCGKAAASIGAIEVCIVRGLFANNVYTLRVGGTLALRASEPLAANGIASPVVDGVMLQCTPKKIAQSVDPSLKATLERSGMTDDQIESSLGEREVSADCAVSSQNGPIANLHFDFK